MRPVAIIGLLLSSAAVASASEFTLDPSRLGKASVQYRDSSQIRSFPVPVVSARRSGLAAGPAEIAEIKEKLLYPLITRSPKPISAIVLEWHPGLPHVLGVLVVWSDGETRESSIPRTPPGRYDDKAYEILFAKPIP